MLRRQFLHASIATAAAAAETPPNIVIILADDLGSADMGYRGSEIRTPNIDRLAAEGVQFERFYSFPLCSPTRAALMTGRSPMRYGILYEVLKGFARQGLPAEEQLMPQSFRAAGYQTAIVGKWHLGHARKWMLPNARGFDHSYGHLNGALDYNKHEFEGGLDWHRNGKSLREEGYSTDLLAAEAVRWIQNRNKAKPLFLYLPFNAPHGPLMAPAGLIDKYPGIANRGRRTYAAMVDSLDSAVGRVLSTLDEQGMRENTLLLFFSDNGGHTPVGASNAPLRGGKATTFEGGMIAPAISRYPAKLKPGSSQQVVTVMDIFPTLAAAAGIKMLNRLPLDGRNIWNAIASGTAARREPLYFAVESQDKLRYAIIDGPWKYVREEPSAGGEATESLFRIEEDRVEANNLAARHTDLIAKYALLIQQWRSQYPAGGTRAGDKAPAGWAAPPQWAEAAQ